MARERRNQDQRLRGRARREVGQKGSRKQGTEGADEAIREAQSLVFWELAQAPAQLWDELKEWRTRNGAPSRNLMEKFACQGKESLGLTRGSSVELRTPWGWTQRIDSWEGTERRMAGLQQEEGVSDGLYPTQRMSLWG